MCMTIYLEMTYGMFGLSKIRYNYIYICVPLKQVMAFNKGGGLAALVCGLEFAIVC